MRAPPSSHQTKIEFRPFLVKEEKLLMVALESKDQKLVVKKRLILEICTQLYTSGALSSTFKVDNIYDAMHTVPHCLLVWRRKLKELPPM